MSLLLGAGLNVLGSVAGAIGSARAQKKADGMIAAQKAKNQAWYDRNYNQNFLERSDAQAVLENTRKFYDERVGRAAATNTVMGGTDEALGNGKGRCQSSGSETMAGINSEAANHKDMVEQNYLLLDSAISQQQIAGQQQRAQNISQAASNASKLVLNIHRRCRQEKRVVWHYLTI